MIGTAGLMVLFVVDLGRHTMALGGFGWANVVFAVALAFAVAGSARIGLNPRPRPGGDELLRPTAARWRVQAAAATAAALPQRNSVPSRHTQVRGGGVDDPNCPGPA